MKNKIKRFLFLVGLTQQSVTQAAIVAEDNTDKTLQVARSIFEGNFQISKFGNGTNKANPIEDSHEALFQVIQGRGLLDSDTSEIFIRQLGVEEATLIGLKIDELIKVQNSVFGIPKESQGYNFSDFLRMKKRVGHDPCIGGGG